MSRRLHPAFRRGAEDPPMLIHEDPMYLQSYEYETQDSDLPQSQWDISTNAVSGLGYPEQYYSATIDPTLLVQNTQHNQFPGSSASSHEV